MSNFARTLSGFGIDPRRLVQTLRGMPKYLQQRSALRSQIETSSTGSAFQFGPLYPVVGEDTKVAGIASGHYFHQDLYVAQKIYEAAPIRHVDVGSRIDGFVAHVASFRPIEVVDLRPLENSISNIHFVQADLMSPGDLASLQTDSLSCLHALEHFGLGRYGDKLEIDGWLQGLRSLAGILKPGGLLYLSVPTGKIQRIEFNAHRVFSVPYLIDVLTKDFEVIDLAFVDDAGSLHTNLPVASIEAQQSFNANYGCSIWTLRKR